MTDDTVNTAYVSPFVCTEDHDSVDPVLCLSRANSAHPIQETFLEFACAAGLVIESDLALGQPSFFLTRQVAELGLKALLATPASGRGFGHDLDGLLAHFQAIGDDLFASGLEQTRIVEFVRELHRLDPGGVEGRYAHTRHGDPALEKVCHAEPDLLWEELNRLVTYIAARLGMPGFKLHRWGPKA